MNRNRSLMTLTKLPSSSSAAAALAACAALLLAGCGSLAPGGAHPPTPDAPVSTTWKSVPPGGGVDANGVDWISTDTHRTWQAEAWWTWFGDTGLNDLMPRIAIGNQNLAQAAANVAQAQALLQQAQAQRLPTLGLNLSTNRSGKPANGSAGLNAAAGWSPDLWGNQADAVRMREANVQANQADLAETLLSAQSSFAQSYFAVREADAELALLDQIITGYERALQITQNQYNIGTAPHTDVLQAQSTLDGARATRHQLAASRDTSEHVLALLLGLPPADFNLPPGSWIDNPPQVPLSLPAELLLRRPDIVSAERAVAAANANIGVARAAYFPNLDLSASVGGSARNLSKLFSAPALAWSLGLTAAETLFDGGARAGAVAQARAEHDAAVATYRQTVLTAMGQVEDDLTQIAALAGQIEQTRLAAQAAQETADRMMNSYRAGITVYSNVVTAQASALSSSRSLLQLQLQRQQTAIGLIQALGGGWQAPWTQTSATDVSNDAGKSDAADAGAAQHPHAPQSN